MLTWVLAPLNIKAKLISFFITDPAGRYMANVYLGKNRRQWEVEPSSGGTPATQLPAAALGMLALQQLAQQAADRTL